MGTVTMEGRSMSEKDQKKPAPLFNLGDRVKVHHSGGTRARIVELRGPIGPGCVQMYRIVVVRKVPGTRPIRTYIDVMEDQLELIPAKAGMPPGHVASDIRP
jgi:hypothetical protein